MGEINHASVPLRLDGDRVELLVEGLKRGLAINEALPSDAGRVECILENGSKTACDLYVEGKPQLWPL